MSAAPINCAELIDAYTNWLRSNTTACKVGEACEVTTPFLDRHNDYVQFYVQRNNGQYVLTDDGNTIRDLELSGVDFSSPRRARLLALALNGFGVRRDGDDLVVEARADELPQKQHSLLQAILSVNDMFMTAKPLVQTLFHEDVEQYLHTHDIRFTPNVQFTGQSHFVHTFDFVIPASKHAPERIVRAINRPTKDTVTSLLFAWNDTRKVRPENAVAFAFLNDEDKTPSGSLLDALKQYDVVPVQWSHREDAAEQLAA
jgi:hypothetical protein